LQTLRDRADPLTISQLATATGLSRPTVGTVLRELADNSPVVHDDRAGASGAGRPARRFRFDPAAGSVAGIDAGPNTLRLTLTDLAGSVLTRTLAPLDPELSNRARMSVLRRLVNQAIADTRAGSLRAIGVGVAGILNHEQRIAHSIALPQWAGYRVVERVSTALGCTAVAENDIKLAALAEHRLRQEGQTPAPPHMLYLQIGHRISVASIVDGHLLQGSHRIAGELGTLRGMRWTESSHRGQLRWRSARTAEAVLARAATGDHEAAQEIADFCAEIAPRIGTIVLTLDPDLIVVGGGLAQAGATFLDPLTTALHHVLTFDAHPPVVRSLLQTHAVESGALGVAFDQLSEHICGVPGLAPPWHHWHPRTATDQQEKP